LQEVPAIHCEMRIGLHSEGILPREFVAAPAQNPDCQPLLPAAFSLFKPRASRISFSHDITATRY
jgi:hypothetical protein